MFVTCQFSSFYLPYTCPLANPHRFVYSSGARDPRAVKEPTALIPNTIATRRRARVELLSSARGVVSSRPVCPSTVEVLLRAETISSHTLSFVAVFSCFLRMSSKSGDKSESM